MFKSKFEGVGRVIHLPPAVSDVGTLLCKLDQ